jgi:hypothetical protein
MEEMEDGRWKMDFQREVCSCENGMQVNLTDYTCVDLRTEERHRQEEMELRELEVRAGIERARNSEQWSLLWAVVVVEGLMIARLVYMRYRDVTGRRLQRGGMRLWGRRMRECVRGSSLGEGCGAGRLWEPRRECPYRRRTE